MPRMRLRRPRRVCGRAAAAPRLGQDVGHNAALVDGTPETVLDTLNPDDDFIHVRLMPAPSEERSTSREEIY